MEEELSEMMRILEKDVEDVRQEISNYFLKHSQSFFDCFIEN